MRRTLFILSFLCTVIGTASAQLRLGLQGGANISNMHFSSHVLDADNRAGFYVGPTLRVPFRGTGLSVDLSALYDQRDVEIDDENVRVRSVLVPLYVRYSFGLGRLFDVFLFAGPQMAFNVSKDKTFRENYQSWKWRDSSLSANLGMGIAIGGNAEINAAYNLVIGKTGEVTWKDVMDGVKHADIRAHAWHVGLTIYF